MNPNISVNWFEISFPVLVVVIAGVQLSRRCPREYLLARLGLLALILALVGAAAANVFYQGALHARVWPTTEIFDQVVVSSNGDVFVKVADPIMGRTARIQRYDCRGKFKAAFETDNAGGLFKFALNPEGTLTVYSVRTDAVETFRLDGTYLTRREMDSERMPFAFLKPGPSVTMAGGCEFVIDPVSRRPAITNGVGIWPLELGDWLLERVLSRRNIIFAALLGGVMLAISLIAKRRQIAPTLNG